MLNFKRELIKLWKTHYIDTNPIKHHIRLNISSKTNKNLTKSLVKKKPSMKMLVHMNSLHTTIPE